MINHLKYTLASENGSVLGMVLVLFLVMTILGTAFLTLAAYEGKFSVRQEQSVAAFFRAESGLNLALWRINHGPDLLGSFSNSEVAVVYDSIGQDLTATGIAGPLSCELAVTLEEDHPFNHIVSYQTVLDTQNYYLTYREGRGIARFDPLPEVDMGYYFSIADYYYDHDETFWGTMPPGIHYIDGKVTMQNGTFLNGTLIATEGMVFHGSVAILAQQMPDSSLYFPAIIAGDTAQTEIDITGTPQLVVLGIVYSTGSVIFKGRLLTGPIVAKHVTLKSGVDINDLGQTTYYQYPPGFSGPDEFDWPKSVVSSTWHRTESGF
ncbi:MAG: hypothetical protein V1681_08005 [Candidatus Neomarinimicrobiota bacterium]